MMLAQPARKLKALTQKISFPPYQWKAVLMSVAAAVSTSQFLRRYIPENTILRSVYSEQAISGGMQSLSTGFNFSG
jgi:hypothetical protein